MKIKTLHIFFFLFFSVWNLVTYHCDEQESLQACASRESHTALISETATACLASLEKITRQGHIQCLQRLDYQQESMVSDDLWVVHKSGLHPNHVFTLAVPTPNMHLPLMWKSRGRELYFPEPSLVLSGWLSTGPVFFWFHTQRNEDLQSQV